MHQVMDVRPSLAGARRILSGPLDLEGRAIENARTDVGALLGPNVSAPSSLPGSNVVKHAGTPLRRDPFVGFRRKGEIRSLGRRESALHDVRRRSVCGVEGCVILGSHDVGRRAVAERGPGHPGNNDLLPFLVDCRATGQYEI